MSVFHRFARAARLLGAAGPFALAITLLSAGAASAADVTVAVPAAKGAKGSDVSVPIRVVGAPGVGALHVELVFDPAVLESKPASAGKLAKNALVDSNPSKGRLVMGLVSSDKIEGDGEILVAHFHVIGDKGQKTPLTLEKVQAWEGTLDRLDIRVTAQAGEFTVTAKSASFPWWIIAVAAALVLLLLLLLAKRRRKDEPTAPAAAVAVHSAVAPPAVVAPLVVGPLLAPSSLPPPAGAPPSTPPRPVSPPPSATPPPSPPKEFWFSVESSQSVQSSEGTMVATLAPGQWYLARRQEGLWTEVEHEGVVGWVATDQIRRSTTTA